ncbi:MAG TPA: GTPase, partial [Edaphobacter sp.]
MAKDNQKRLGKKHRQASTRPKKGRAPKTTATTGAVAPKNRKQISAKKVLQEKLKRVPKRSPDKEAHVPLTEQARRPPKSVRPAVPGRLLKKAPENEEAQEMKDWREAELEATRYNTIASIDDSVVTQMPLIAVCGRPNVGKSTLFNRLTGTRRSIVGDEPGITRDRIYGEVEWAGRVVRVVDTGGVIPDDEALIPS